MDVEMNKVTSMADYEQRNAAFDSKLGRESEAALWRIEQWPKILP